MAPRQVALLVLLWAAATAVPSAGDEAPQPPIADPTQRLHHAALTNNAAAAKAAIEEGADINARGGAGQTPIMAATLSGSIDVVQLLLDEYSSRVDMTIGEENGYTPMHGAAFQGRHKIGRMLIQAGLDPSDRHKDGYTPIHRACWGTTYEHTRTVKMLLIDGKVNINELAENGLTPLDSAKKSGNKETIWLLQAHGGYTAADLASKEKGRDEL